MNDPLVINTFDAHETWISAEAMQQLWKNSMKQIVAQRAWYHEFQVIFWFCNCNYIQKIPQQFIKMRHPKFYET